MRVLALHRGETAGLERPWVAIGNFDGLHVGHAELIRRLVARARQAGSPAAVMTFSPHPAAVLGTRGAPARLLSDMQREEILAAWGVEALLVARFDHALAALPAADYVRTELREGLGVGGVVVGSAFRFGRGREGDVDLLRAELAAGGADLVAIEPLIAGGDVVSSSRIRRLVADGEDAAAGALLGRPFVLEAQVVRGDARGRLLGFPTANLEAPGSAVPGAGVHACVAALGEATWRAVANVGTRPTVGGTGQRVEVHVLGEPGDLYGRTLRVAFLERLRDERRFDGLDELARQIAADVRQAESRLAGVDPPSLRGPGF